MVGSNKTKEQRFPALKKLQFSIAEFEKLEAEYKEAEEELKKSNEFNFNLIEQSPHPIVVAQPDNTIVRVNPAFEQLTGYCPSEAIGRKPPYPWWAAKARGLRELKRNRRLALERRGCKVESKRKKKNGEIFWIELTPTAIIVDGEPKYYMSLWTDITDHKRLEREILEISDWEQWRIGQALHDGLSQALAGISYISNILEQKLSAKSLPEASDATQITTLVNQTLLETRPLAKGLQPNELKEEGLVTALEELAANTKQTFNISCKYQSSRTIRFNNDSIATHLYLIAKEAVNNAIRHGKPQNILISLDTGHGMTTLTVKDDGIGISGVPSSNQGRGLHIMKYRAKMIHALLSIKQGTNGGTIVTCSLPNKRISIIKAREIHGIKERASN